MLKIYLDILFITQSLLSLVFLFNSLFYLLYWITFFVKLGSPQGLPNTNVSHCRMVVNITAQKALVFECRRLLAITIAVYAVRTHGISFAI